MESATTTASPSKKMYWAGWVSSALPVLMLLFSASMKFSASEDAVKGFNHLGWDENYALGLGIVELASTIIYLIPKTSVLGAILLTGYLGGATATHVRIGELAQGIAPVVFGVLVWLGIYLRCGRLRGLIPLRS